MAVLVFLSIFPAMLVGLVFLLIFMVIDVIFDTDLVLWAFGLLDTGWGILAILACWALAMYLISLF
jgi:hypothetical protein